MNDIATLTPPKGWKVLNDSQKQRFINEHLSGAEDIIAIALPDSGDGSVFAQLSYRPAGYVDENIQIDPTRVRQGISEDLDMLNQESGLTGNDAVRWKTFSPAPKYDSANHCVEYGVELTIGQDSVLNRYKMYLVRNGAVILTLVGTPACRRHTHQPALDEPLYLKPQRATKKPDKFRLFYFEQRIAEKETYRTKRSHSSSDKEQ